ncbi:purine and uridine phosphorylase [Apiospora arundinis]
MAEPPSSEMTSTAIHRSLLGAVIAFRTSLSIKDRSEMDKNCEVPKNDDATLSTAELYDMFGAETEQEIRGNNDKEIYSLLVSVARFCRAMYEEMEQDRFLAGLVLASVKLTITARFILSHGQDLEFHLDNIRRCIEDAKEIAVALDEVRYDLIHQRRIRIASETPHNLGKVDVAGSEYTSAIPKSQAYIQEFVASLFEVSKQPDVAAVKRIAGILPNLLRGFALSIGGENSTAGNLEVMKFFLGSRSEVVERFVEYYIRDRDDGVPLRRSPSQMSLTTKVDQWSPELATGDPNLVTPQPPLDTVAFGDPDQNEVENEGGDDDFKVEKYREIIAGSAAFRWLQCRLNHEIDMDVSKANVMNAISSKIRETLYSSPESRLVSRHRGPESRLVSRYRGPTMFETTFASSWNPLAFFREQEYVEEPGEALARAVVLVQDVNGNTQALSCSEYLSCTWNMCGEDFMGLVQQVVEGSPGSISKLTGWLESSGELSLKVVGLTETTAEVGEMFGWMIIALSEAPTNPFARTIPVIRINQGDTDGIYRAMIISYSIGELIGELETSDGHCWLELFRHPTIVYGFPVKCRQSGANQGLEVSLSTLAGLLGTNRLVILCDLFVLRGFCTMVVPTSYAKDTVYWHVLFNEDGSRIASTDTRVHDVAGDFRLAHHLMPSTLDTRRHIIGWCRDACNFAGTKRAHYKVKKSGLGKPASGLTLDRINISGGKFLTVGIPIAMGKKDRPVRAAKASDYHKQLDWAENQYVVLYDCDDRCGWLIDGLSALLHLTRARLAHRRDQKRTVQFKDGQITEAKPPLGNTGKRAARSLLTNQNNMALKIYEKRRKVVEEIVCKGKENEEEITKKTTRTWEEFPDIVGDIFQTLGLLFDIQTDTKTLDGINFKIRTSPRRNLQGWDFYDVATDADPLWLKEASLDEMGWGWVDLVRGINAVVLFGNNFGDIILPGRSSTSAAAASEGSTETTLCEPWRKLPKNRDLLATTTAVIDDIMKNIRQDTAKPLLQLHDGIYWHSPDQAFEECQSDTQAADSAGVNVSKPKDRGKKQEHTCDRVQVLLPANFLSHHRSGLRSPELSPKRHGGVIFGHSSRFRLLWPDVAGSIPTKVCAGTTKTAQEGQRVHESNAVSSTSNSEASTTYTSSPVPDSGSSQTGAETGTVASSVAGSSTTPADPAPSPREGRDRYRWLKGRK